MSHLPAETCWATKLTPCYWARCWGKIATANETTHLFTPISVSSWQFSCCPTLSHLGHSSKVTTPIFSFIVLLRGRQEGTLTQEADPRITVNVNRFVGFVFHVCPLLLHPLILFLHKTHEDRFFLFPARRSSSLSLIGCRWYCSVIWLGEVNGECLGWPIKSRRETEGWRRRPRKRNSRKAPQHKDGEGADRFRSSSLVDGQLL